MKHTLPLFVLITLLLSSCFKKVDCDNAKTCVINASPDTIYYAWLCGTMHTSDEDTLPPGEMTCDYVGEIFVRRQTRSTDFPCFTTRGATYRWEVDDCYVEKVMQ